MFEQKSRRKPLLLIAFMLLFVLAELFSLSQVAQNKEDMKVRDAVINAQSIANTIQLTIENATEASEALKYFYIHDEEKALMDFQSIAGSVMLDHPMISSMYIAPDALIAAAWPEAVAESTIGFEMLKDPAQGPRAQYAIDTGKITIAGPHNLVEGGIGLIIRNPVFENGAFKGFTIIILNWDKVVENILGLSDFSMASYRFAVWKDTPDETAVTDSDGFIFRSSDDPIGRRVDVEFEVPNDVWHLTIEPVDGWSVFREMQVYIVMCVIITLAMLLLIIYLYRRNEEMRRKQLQKAEDEARQRYMEQLQEALDQSKRADAAKTVFLSQLSHDIRTPLNGIIGLIEINTRHSDDRELVDRNRGKIKVAANHLLSLINDVLELSKMGDENVQLVDEPFDIRELAEDVVTITSVRAVDHGIRLKYDREMKGIAHRYVYGSPLYVRQIMINIFSNAIKYNKPDGSIYSSMEVVHEDADSITYRCTVTDTGIGMSEEFLTRMFEPFSQERSDARSVYQGTGLGMSIVKALVEKMNGTVEVNSRLGEGTTFVVTVPFRKAAAGDMPQKAMTDSISLTGMKLLLVEDNELNMEIAETILTDAGAIITKAFNGQEAVEAFSANPPGTFDGILMDLMMPVMDGFQATAAIRALDRADAKDIPIIAMTANAFQEDVRKCLAAGMDGHIAKPLEVDTLLETIARIAK
ncbi:MAG: ATP-binding protein [Clostridia bacterium]|nr:ATP-binding protein [Clostridia bacterium]